MIDAADTLPTRPSLRLVTSDSPNHRVLEKGKTFGDALRLMASASGVYVAVPHGFGDSWSYFTVTKAEAQRSLTGVGRQLDAPLASTLTEVIGTTNLYLGDVYAIGQHDDALRSAVATEMAR